MTPLKNRLRAKAEQTGLRLDTIQQDYVLTWILSELSKDTTLSQALIFKGGTALKKCYFGSYRFSEDLDFTARDDAPTGSELELAIKKLCEVMQERIHAYAPLSITCERYFEKNPHPFQQEAFVIRTQFPWQREPLTKIMIEITRDETVLTAPVLKTLIHEYEEAISGEVLSYSLEEIVLEKLRAVLQHTKKLHERHWSRSRSRDYYDLWRILCYDQIELSLKNPYALLQKKCTGKGVNFQGVDAFFEPIMLANVKQTWGLWLGPLIHQPPDLNQVISELKEKLLRVFL